MHLVLHAFVVEFLLMVNAFAVLLLKAYLNH